MTRPVRVPQLLDFLARPKTARQIAHRFRVSERTAFRDIQELSRWLPIRKTKHGYLLEEGATIPPLALTAREQSVLRLVLENPAVLKTPDVGTTLRRVGEKLDAAMDDRGDDESRSEQSWPELKDHERSGPIPEGLFARMEEAVRQRTPVSIRYRSLSGRRMTWRGLDPWKLFHREGTWYVIGRCHEHDDGRTFRLDRVTEARPAEGSFEPPDIDLDADLKRTWGVMWGRALHDVVIEFDPDLAPLIEHSVHHPEERIRWPGNGRLEYRVTLSNLNEIARWIVGFGGQARALAPPALVRIVADMGRRCHERHAHAVGRTAGA